MYKDRRSCIRQLLTQKPFVSLAELSEKFPEVSEMTLRRDIEYFERLGEAVKVRGGARSSKFISETRDASFTNRMEENTKSKDLIAKCAAQFLDVGRSIFIDSGSTLQHLVPYVPNDRFTFTTTNPSIAMELCKIGLPAVNLVGGRLDRDYRAVTGMQAMRFLADINIDTAILSPSGLSAKSGFTGGNYNECLLKRAVVEKARLTVMLMDITKADRSLPYTFCELKDVHVLICDGELPSPLAEQAELHGVRVINAGE